MFQARRSELSHLKMLQIGFSHKETGTGAPDEPRVLPWQQHNRCHSVSFVMYISGAKFEKHCSNISGDIFDLLFY